MLLPSKKLLLLLATSSCRLRVSPPRVILARASSSSQDWVPVYRYPGIRGCQLLAKAKFVQTLASVSYLPYSDYRFSIGAVDATWFSSTAVMAIAAPLLLALFSRCYINRLVD